jgi:hypothetical protein
MMAMLGEECMPVSSNVPHDSFREGFVVDYQLVKGIAASVPGSTAGFAPHGGTTKFLEGVKEGIKAAGGQFAAA